MYFEITHGPDGKVETCKNVVVSHDGTIDRWSGPPMNAVLVQLFRGQDDEDGNPTYRRFISTLNVDKDMEEAVRKEAERIIRP